MKKRTFGFLILSAAACSIFLIIKFSSQPPTQSQDTEIQNVAKAAPYKQKRVLIKSHDPDVIQIPAAEKKTYPKTVPFGEGRAKEEIVVYTSDEVVTPQPENAVIHSVADFAHGEVENLVIDGSLRLANPPGFLSKGEKIIGTLYSMPAEAREPFDSVTVTYQGLNPDDSSTLKMEVRVRFENIGWSDWLSINMDNISLPIALEAMADSWQYRVTMSADEILKSPQLDQVVVIPQTTAQHP